MFNIVGYSIHINIGLKYVVRLIGKITSLESDSMHIFPSSYWAKPFTFHCLMLAPVRMNAVAFLCCRLFTFATRNSMVAITNDTIIQNMRQENGNMTFLIA